MSITNLELVQSKSTSSPDSSIVSDSLTMYYRSQEASDGSGSDGGSLFQTLCSPPLLLSGLVKPSPNIPAKFKNCNPRMIKNYMNGGEQYARLKYSDY